MPRLRTLVKVGSMVSTALLGLALPAAAATASTGPRLAPSAKIASPTAEGSDDYFEGNSCTSSTFCMAVGAFSQSGRTPALSAMLSAGNWVAEPVSRPSHGGNIFANEVSCASSTSCLFVGQHWAGQHGHESILAEAWNGASWRITAATGPAGTTYSALGDVACPTTKFCLAVGAAGNGRDYQDTAYTWENGTTWQRISIPRPRRARNSEMGGVACFSSRSCMAVGNYTNMSGRFVGFAARWRDGRWKLVTTPAVPRQRFAAFQGIACPTATRCVAVGQTEDNTRGEYYHAFAEAWNGHKWHLSTLRRQPSLFLGISCPALNRCFAAGSTFPSTTAFAHPLIETWNGRTWTTQHPARTSAPDSGDSLEHVSCATRDNCEAVGYSFNPAVSNSDQTLAEYWNGQDWKVQTTINP